MKNTLNKTLSIFLAILMIVTMIPMSVFAEEAQSRAAITVAIESFLRGPQEDLRSSELLQARVYGYDGNVNDLTYKWTNGLGTYLYVYNSQNMYGINNTSGEVEIGSSRSYSAKGFAWAAVYGAYGSNSARSALNGTVKVEVYANGVLIGSDEHTGKVTNNGTSYRPNYTYDGFIPFDLSADLQSISIGIFEGEERDAKRLLGESGILHITCTASIVEDAEVVSGEDYVRITGTTIKGVKAGSSDKGDAKVELTVSKDNCKFHQYDDGGAATINVFVFQKPATATTATTLTLVNGIDPRCEYFIDGVEGTKQSDGTIVFTGLTPNTEYQVEVRATYTDNGEEKHTYAYVYDTTKPYYLATVKTYLDGVITSASDIHGDTTTLYLHEKNDTAGNYIKLEESAEGGTYMAAVPNGAYFIWHSDDGDYHQINNHELVIANTNDEIEVHHYTVSYDTDGGSFEEGEDPGKVILQSGSPVSTTKNVPVRDGYNFLGWEYNGKTYNPEEAVTSGIVSTITFKAKWEKTVNVTINVIVDHETDDGSRDPGDSKFDVEIALLHRLEAGGAYIEIDGASLDFTKNSVKDSKGNEKAYKFEYTPSDVTDDYITETKYTATEATFAGLADSAEFGVSVKKSGYDIDREKLTKVVDKDGNVTITVPLVYNPDDFDIKLSVEMDEDVPEDLYPDAVIAKILFWEESESTWKTVTQQEGDKPGIRIDIDEDGNGVGEFPVWKHYENAPSYYRFYIAAYVYDETKIVVPTENTEFISYSDGNYTTTIGDVADGMLCGALYGAYYDETINAQVGTLHGVITVESYDIAFDAQGGINEEDRLEEQYFIPSSINENVPTMAGHNFLGWYGDKECTQPAAVGKLLTEDITLYAKWDKKVHGAVTVDGTYEMDGKTVKVNDHSRATYALVELEEISDSNYIIDTAEVEITWSGDKGISTEFSFSNLDPDKTYRIEVEVPNYGVLYQNIITPAGEYNETDYKAVYNEEDYRYDTFVNANLHFKPETFVQPLEVDASAIGENFRPEETLVEIHYKEPGYGDTYKVIDQHTVEPFGVEVVMDKNTGLDDGDYTYEVWKELFNGDLYTYQANLTKIDGDKASEWPVLVGYGEASRYSPLNGAPTGILKVIIVPDRFDIVYDLNYEDAEDVTDGKAHTWSFDTAITYEPIRDGYTFGGWYANEECTGEAITEIDASVSEATKVYAKWNARTDLYLTVNHLEKDSGIDLGSETKLNQTFGEVVTAESLKKEIEGYTYDSASSDEVVIGLENNEITLYYTRNSYNYTVNYLEEGTNQILADAKTAAALYDATVKSADEVIAITDYVFVEADVEEITIGTDETKNVINLYYAADTVGGGEDGEEPDNIPDKYQKKVIYKVVNGTWADDTTADKSEYVELKKDGEWAEDGTATITAPTGMKADEGYAGGEWNPVIPATVSGTDTETFTYSFVIRTDLTLKVNYVDKADNTVLDTETKANQTFGDVVTAESLKKEIKDYTYDSASADSIVIALENNEITLYYVKNIHNYTVNYLEEGTNKVLADAKTANALHGDVVTENAIAITGYIVVGNSSATVTVDKDGIVINFFYALDAVGGGEDGDEPDNIPDKYQKKVIYKVVNGTWADNTTADKFEYVELKTDGEWDVNGTAEINAPTGMIANDGFTGGMWSPEIPETVSGTETETFTYGFVVFATPIIPLNNVRYIVEHYIETAVGTYPAEPTETEIFNGEIGTEVTATAKTYEGYVFDELVSNTSGTLVPIRAYDDIVILRLYYNIDKMGGGEEYDRPDGIPDKYQKLVIYRIINGTWEDGTTEPIIQLVELKTDGIWDANGTATVFVPTGMVGYEGYPIGFWDVTPSETVSGAGISIHNYVFTDFEPAMIPGMPAHIVFGKTNGIGWYKVSKDFGATWETVFGDSTYEVEVGSVLLIRAEGPLKDDFRFYVNGDAYEPVAGYIVLTVRGYSLVGALDTLVTVPDVDESISIIEKIINFIKMIFERIAALFKL